MLAVKQHLFLDIAAFMSAMPVATTMGLSAASAVGLYRVVMAELSLRKWASR